MKRSRRNPDPKEVPDLSLLEGTVDANLLEAVRIASRQLTKLGIRHALVGGLAVGAYGHVRATKDIDFLIGDEGFVHHGGGLVSTVDGFPLSVGPYKVDALSAPPGDEHLEDSLDRVEISRGVPVIPIEELIFMKLKSPRPKDAIDILELLALGYSEKKVEGYLRHHAPEVLAKFERLVQQWRGTE